MMTPRPIPEASGTAEVGGVRLEVLRMDHRRIGRLRVDVSQDGNGAYATG
jgi:CBS domain containing-hemolysin-like protein